MRFDPKDFRQRRPVGTGKWEWNLKGVKRPLPPYRLPELLKADPEDLVFDTEGEKDAESLRGLGLVATCNPCGAGKWNTVDDTSLHGRHVVVIADKDAPGLAHAVHVVASLFGKAASVRILQMPGDAKDVSDWIEAEQKRTQNYFDPAPIRNSRCCGWQWMCPC